MGDKSAIEWLDGGATWTPVRARSGERVGWHCEHVTEACRFCYAETLNRRLGTGLDFKPGLRPAMFLDEKMLRAPLRWRRHRRIFVFSMSDLFGSWVLDAWLDWIFAVIAASPQHTFIILTKRPERMKRFMDELAGPERMALVEQRAKRLLRELAGDDSKPVMVGKTLIGTWPWPHVWAGISAGDQADADLFIPILLSTPVARRIVSLEPLLGPIDLTRLRDADAGEPGIVNALTGTMETATRVIDGEATLSWIIAGGESGQEARPCDPAWARALRDQCTAAAVPFFWKQWGTWRPAPDDLDLDGARSWARQLGYSEKSMTVDGGTGRTYVRMGKDKSGRGLDGRTWDQAPVDVRAPGEPDTSDIPPRGAEWFKGEKGELL